MADFVKLNEFNIVVKGITIHDNECPTEEAGVAFINNLFKTDHVWKKTDPDTFEGTHLKGGTPFRKNFAGVGYSYDESRDAFIPPKPYPSWVLDEDKCIYVAPVAEPITYTQNLDKFDENGNILKDEEGNTILDNDNYEWNEETTSWVMVPRKEV